MNIYDLAGNEYEWTLEYVTTSNDYHCACRGGGYDFSSSNVPSSSRNFNGITYGFYNVGFRTSLYEN